MVPRGAPQQSRVRPVQLDPWTGGTRARLAPQLVIVRISHISSTQAWAGHCGGCLSWAVILKYHCRKQNDNNIFIIITHECDLTNGPEVTHICVYLAACARLCLLTWVWHMSLSYHFPPIFWRIGLRTHRDITLRLRDIFMMCYLPSCSLSLEYCPRHKYWQKLFINIIE